MIPCSFVFVLVRVIFEFEEKDKSPTTTSLGLAAVETLQLVHNLLRAEAREKSHKQTCILVR